MLKGELPKVTWEKIVEHIDHAAKTAGVDHVGLGSDFDGATMPLGMEDVSKLPKITDALLKKGYSEQDVQKILGGNILRVMDRWRGHPDPPFDKRSADVVVIGGGAWGQRLSPDATRVTDVVSRA